MSEPRIDRIDRWTVQYPDSDEDVPVIVPHAWRQDLPVAIEGPVIYRTCVEVPAEGGFLVFHGVSYEAEVRIDGDDVATHRGIWDAFSIPLGRYAGKEIAVTVTVTKNGGPSFPIRNVASGFLPFVFHTFGGIYRDVEVWRSAVDPIQAIEADAKAPTRVSVEGRRIFVDGKPFYVRGLLHWGWFPDVGHTNPPEASIRKEVLAAKALGFNLVKFCLWVPSHRYLEILAEEGLEAWLELPLWDPAPDPDALQAIASEFQRIARQFRRHRNIVAWTIGCELHGSTPAEFRERLTASVKNLTGAPLVKDNSGGAEMYGGDLREFGDFYDFHPYCDLPFYPPVLDSLLPGPRQSMPTVLGEFNDFDAHRDLARTRDATPFWASALPELNEQGVRWKLDLPQVLQSSRFADEPGLSGHADLMDSSRTQALFVRKTVHEWVRARDPYGGYVLTGWRDTPVTSSGMFDDWGTARFTPEETAPWNGPTAIFLIPSRRPPWVRGGNRPGHIDPFNHFAGQVVWRIGAHSEHEIVGRPLWSIEDSKGSTLAHGVLADVRANPLESREIGLIVWDDAPPGEYRLSVELGDARNSWAIWVVPRPNFDATQSWETYDPAGFLDGLNLGTGDGLVTTRIPTDLADQLDAGRNVLLFMLDEGTVGAPFFREAAYEFDEDFKPNHLIANRWERLLAVSPDRAIDPGWPALDRLAPETIMNRIDVRTGRETPITVRSRKKGTLLATTLRPFGGLGIQPRGVASNAVGAILMEALLDSF